MDKKKLNIQFVWATTLCSFSFLALYPAEQILFYVLFPLLSVLILLLGGSSFFRRRYIFVYIFVVAFVSFVIVKIKSTATLWAGVPIDCVNSISGFVVYDSSFTKSGNHFMTIFITQAKSIYGQTVNARGLVNVIGNERAIITSGIKITLDGRFSDGLFKYKNLQVLSRSFINDLREFLIVELEKRITGFNFSDANYLSIMLLLGRCEDFNNPIKSAATDCGCSHILALSGMHLNTLGLIFRPIKNRSIRYVFTVVVSVVFVFVAGPRPSLIRALFMLIFSFLPTVEKLVVSFIVQMLLFPFSILNIGCVYSYLAIYAIYFIVPILKHSVPLPESVVSSVAVLFFIAPIELLSTQTWHPISIVAGPITGILITISMLLGLLIVIIGPIAPLCSINDFVCKILLSVLNKFATFPSATWKAYVFFAVGVVVFLALVPVLKLILVHRFKKLNKTPIIDP